MVDRPPTPVPPDVSRDLLLELSRPRTTQDPTYRELQPYKKSRWRDFALNRSLSAYCTWPKYATWCVTSILKDLRVRHLRLRRLSREVHATKLRPPPGPVKGLKEAFSRSLLPPRNGHCIIHPLCWFDSKGGSYIPESFRELPLRDREVKDPTGDRSKPSVSSSQQVTPVSRPAPPNQTAAIGALHGAVPRTPRSQPHLEAGAATSVKPLPSVSSSQQVTPVSRPAPPNQTAAIGALHGAVPRTPRSQPHLEPGVATSVKPPTAPRRNPPVSFTQSRTKLPRKPPSDGEFAEAFIKALQIELSSFETILVRREALLQAALAESVTESTRKREESPPVRIPKPNYSLMKEGPPPAPAGGSRGSEDVWSVPGWDQPAQPSAASRAPRPRAPRAGGPGWAARTRERRSTAAWKNCPCNSHPNRQQAPAANPPTYLFYIYPQQFKALAIALANCRTNEDLSEDTENDGLTLEDVLEVCKISEDDNENMENDKTTLEDVLEVCKISEDDNENMENDKTHADGAANEQSGRRCRRRRRRRGKKAPEDANQEQQQQQQQRASPVPSMPNA